MSDPFKGTPFWQPKPDERAALLGHLMAELPVGHVLWTHRDSLSVVARDREGDRLVVTTDAPEAAVALVEMTWSRRPPMAPFLPETEIFASLDALMAALKEDTRR